MNTRPSQHCCRKPLRHATGWGTLALAAMFVGCIEADLDRPPTPHLSGNAADGSVDFATVPVGSSRELRVDLVNGYIGYEHYATLEDIRVTVEGPDLQMTLNDCDGVAVRGPGSCAVLLKWTPTRPYTLAARVVVTSNAPSSPTTMAIAGVATP